MAAFPTTFFFRMAYSESIFFVLVVLAMYALSKHWNEIAIALVIGLATAARPVGIAMLAPFVLYLWNGQHSLKNRLIYIALLVPLACWGIALYTAFLWWQFGEPFAWVKSQQMWYNRPDPGLLNKLLALAAFEPVWASYDLLSICYWHQPGQPDLALLSMRFWNPIYFVAAVALMGVGIWKKWLNQYEILLGIALLLIPYLTRGCEMCMESQGRFVSIVFPIYLVLGQLLARLPAPVAVALIAASALMMAIHAATFAAGYVVI
jgi:hypothetical protein